MNADTKRKIAERVSRTMTAQAEQRRCPNCGRKAALKKTKVDPFLSILTCRWCTYERALTTPIP